MAVTARNYSSVAVTTTLSSGINSSVTTFNVAASTGWPAAPFIAVLDPNTVNEEIILVGTAAGTSWSSITRGYDSSAAVSHNAGSSVQHMVVGIDFREAQNHAVSTTSNVHSLGVGSVVVGTTDSQTLTNKTLTAPTLNSPVLTNAGGAATLSLPSTTDTLVGRATTDTLTNKTLTSPTINTPVFSGVATGSLTSLVLNSPSIIGYSGSAVNLPAGPDTLVGRATTDTLTNKTLTSPSITTPTITGSGGVLTLPAGPGTLFATSNFQKKNFLDNASFLINQYGSQRAASGIAQYKIDRWFTNWNTATGNGGIGSGAMQSGITYGSANTPSGYCANWLTNAGSSGSPGYGATVEQRYAVQDVPWALSGKTVTFSLYGAVLSTYRLNVKWVVNYGTGGSPSATTTTTLGSLTFSTGSLSTFSRQSVTATLPSFTGTWGSNGDGYVSLVLESDSTNGTVVSVFVADAQLELGSVATQFVPERFADDLRRCQSYFVGYTSQGANYTSFEGYVYSVTPAGGNHTVRCPIHLPTTMFGNPTIVSAITGPLATTTPTSTQIGIVGPGSGGGIGYWGSGTPTLATLYPSGPNIGYNSYPLYGSGVNKITINILVTGGPAVVAASPSTSSTNPPYPASGQAVTVVMGPQTYFGFSVEP